MKLLEGTPQEVLDDVYHNVITLTPGAETFCRILKQVRTLHAHCTHSARTLHALCTRSFTFTCSVVARDSTCVLVR